jgi:glycosyltransferase involved in cell wall biosynthesis
VIQSYAGSPSIYAQLFRPSHRARVAWRLEHVQSAPTHRRIPNRIASRIEQSLAKRVSLFIAGSQTARERAIEREYPAPRIIVIPNGVDLDHFKRDEGGRITTRNAWRIPETSQLIGQVGPLDSNRDFPTFLQAAAIVAKARPDAHFVCIGGGTPGAINELRRLGDRLGLGERIIWTGAVTLQASTYSALDLLVNSSSSGASVPVAIAEAMACGVPVVTTDVGDAAWTVGDDRFVVAPSNPEALAEAMLRLLRDVDDRLIDRGALRARIDRDLSVDRFLDRIQAALFGAKVDP